MPPRLQQPYDRIILYRRGEGDKARYFIHLPHGSDCPVRPQQVFGGFMWNRLTEFGNVIIWRTYCCDYNFDDLRRQLFIDALKFIRQDVQKAALFGATPPDFEYDAE